MFTNLKLYSEDNECFGTRKNGLFLYNYLPSFFKVYHFEETFPEFLFNIQKCYYYINHCYYYLRKLNDEIVERNMKEEEEKVEINEENIIIIIFLWGIVKEEEEKKKDISCLISLTVRVLE